MMVLTAIRGRIQFFLVSGDLKGNGAGIVSLPRDTRVEVPGYSQHYKLNSAYALGGMDLFLETVENLLDVPIHFFCAD